jgi:hypothetical protein
MSANVSLQLLNAHFMSGVEVVDRSVAWMAVQELHGVLQALQQACQQAVGWDELQPVVAQALSELDQVNLNAYMDTV